MRSPLRSGIGRNSVALTRREQRRRRPPPDDQRERPAAARDIGAGAVRERPDGARQEVSLSGACRKPIAYSSSCLMKTGQHGGLWEAFRGPAISAHGGVRGALATE